MCSVKELNWQETIPVAKKYDLIVCGGGVAGVAAALAGRRRGLSTLLLDKLCVLGGLATAGLVNYWVPLCNGRGKYIIKGLAQELLQLSLAHSFNTLSPDWKHGEPNHETTQRSDTFFSGGMFSLALLKLLTDEGVDIVYDALVSAPVMDGKHCAGVIIDGKSGRRFHPCAGLVDATGDASIMKQAGVPTTDGKNFFTYYGEGITLDGCRAAVEKKNIFLAYYHPFGGDANLHGQFQPDEKLPYVGCSMETINQYLQENQLRMYDKESGHCGMEQNIHTLPGIPQLRTARRIQGIETLTGENCYRHCDTSIGTICDFEYRDRLYEVPYGVLIKDGFDNLITCGRSASASGWGWDVLRVIPAAVLTGQAAGTAAALAVFHAVPIADVPIEKLQKALADTGVIIHFDDSWVPQAEADDGHAASIDHI